LRQERMARPRDLARGAAFDYGGSSSRVADSDLKHGAI
jgi:hypothetical protein